VEGSKERERERKDRERDRERERERERYCHHEKPKLHIAFSQVAVYPFT
jgi:hypothetical protein